MSVVEVKPTDDVISIAEDGTPVTGNMILEWCAAYDRGEYPGRVVEEKKIGRPPLHGERMSTITIRIPRDEKAALEDEARRRGVSTSEYVRGVLETRIA